MNDSNHLRPEVVFGYRNRLLTADEFRGVDSHIASCEACREELARQMDIPRMAAAVHQSLRQPEAHGKSWIPYAAAAAVVLAAGAVWIVKSRPAANAETALVDDALRSGHIPLPEFVAGLLPRHEVLMGQGGQEAQLNLISPAATAVISTRPVFRWKPLGDAWKYSVRVFRPGFELQLASPAVAGTEWLPDVDLLRGIDYEWQVTASRGVERVTLPQPPQTPPRFRVVDRAQAELLLQLARRAGMSHLALAVEYGRAGLIEDSRRELNEELLQHPENKGVRRLLDNLPGRDLP